MGVQVRFNDENYNAIYNEQTDYYEIELDSTGINGISVAEITYTSIYDDRIDENKDIRIYAKEKITIETNKVFMWIFSEENFEVIDIVELSDYEICIDEETNINSLINVVKKTKAKAKDIIAIKKDNKVIYWGIIDKIQNENGSNLYTFSTKYITNLFAQEVELKNEETIRRIGIEKFISDTIKDNFITNQDTFVNKHYLEVTTETSTILQKSVDNVENGIYNLHTWMTNCTQNYNIVYEISIVNKKLRINIKKENVKKGLIDVFAQNISNYTEIFETDIVSKVKVLTKEEGSYTLYLRVDRTTTTNMLDTERASGNTKIIYTENMEDAPQLALDVIKQNSYKHMVSFNCYDTYLKIGTPIALKTRKSIILDSYISSIKIIKSSKFIEYTCGTLRIKLLDKLLKERNR